MQAVMNPFRSPTFWGALTLVMTLIVGLGVAYVYVSPPSQRIVTFYTDDAIAVRPDDTVRIAGIVVGKIKDLSLEPDQVRVRALVDRSAFVGDQSQVEVRMLTVVGGYYVSIKPLGDTPLGGLPIPKERVTMPYSLMRTLADATKITGNVSTRSVNESFKQLQEGLTGTNTDTLTRLINAGNSITDAMTRQGGQISRILEASNEYVEMMNNNRELIVYLISKIAIIEQTLTLYDKGLGGSLIGLGKIGDRLGPVGIYYMNHRDDFLAKIRGILGDFQSIGDRSGGIVGALRAIRERMERTLAAQDNYATRSTFGGAPSAPELFATDLCIPVEGSRC